jgi:hypothetical protein
MLLTITNTKSPVTDLGYLLHKNPSRVQTFVQGRMPVILDRESYDLRLDPGTTDEQIVSELLKPYDARLMRLYLCAVASTMWRTMTKNVRGVWRSLRHRIVFSPEKN